jgi:hypothetical protein
MNEDQRREWKAAIGAHHKRQRQQRGRSGKDPYRPGLARISPNPTEGETSMTTCRTLEEVLAAADRDSQADPPLSQETVDLVAALIYANVPAPGGAAPKETA